MNTETLWIIVFILGYLLIAFEHPIKVNKTAIALLTGTIMWIILSFVVPPEMMNEELNHKLSEIAQILLFLISAMTIVELIDAHNGFGVVTDSIKTTKVKNLLWLISFITFGLSAILDNLTTSIVMVVLINKIITDSEQKKFFAGMIVLAANAGGAWSPMGDVTTTMLWIGGQISALNIVKTLILPSLVCMMVPLIYLSFTLKGVVSRPVPEVSIIDKKDSNIMLVIGLLMLLLVPAFKAVFHLPPYIGTLFGLGVVWLVSEIIHSDRDEEEKKPFTAVHALSRIEISSVLFFLGILLAISCLEVSGILHSFASWLDGELPNRDHVAIILGFVSAIVDNVPLVAAAQAMYSLESNPMDSKMWEFIAYSAGTGGSMLIIGSAAGIAVMSMAKIDFFWYLKKVSWLALLGFLAGALVYMLVYPIFAVH